MGELCPELVKMTNEKEFEKREFNWKLVGDISFVLMIVAGVSARVLGRKFDLKLSKER